MKVDIGDFVSHKDFGNGVVCRLNMSGPIVKFADYDNEMCIPLWDTLKAPLKEIEECVENSPYQDFQAIALEEDIKKIIKGAKH